ncbi:hypothetical protein LTSEJOH_2026, partial [Salmonella enterica subsp. enterica serovar Johannesburg str. S5-703]
MSCPRQSVEKTRIIMLPLALGEDIHCAIAARGVRVLGAG